MRSITVAETDIIQSGSEGDALFADAEAPRELNPIPDAPTGDICPLCGLVVCIVVCGSFWGGLYLVLHWILK
jgi:hypothetical protein